MSTTALINESHSPDYHFQLFISGLSTNSIKGIKTITSLCQKHIKGQYDLEIIDVYQQPEIAQKEHIKVFPTLKTRSPMSSCEFVGDLSSKENTFIKMFGMQSA